MKEPQPDITQFIGALKQTILYEAYPLMLASCELANQMIQNADNETSAIWSPVATKLEIGSALSNQLASDFWSVSFTNHFAIKNWRNC